MVDEKQDENLEKTDLDFEKDECNEKPNVTESKLDGTNLEENLNNEKMYTPEIDNNEEAEL